MAVMSAEAGFTLSTGEPTDPAVAAVATEGVLLLRCGRPAVRGLRDAKAVASWEVEQRSAATAATATEPSRGVCTAAAAVAAPSRENWTHSGCSGCSGWAAG